MMLAETVALDLDQVQSEYREAERYVETGHQLRQEGYAVEAGDCLAKAIELYQTLVDQLLKLAKSDKRLTLTQQAPLSPKQRIDRFQSRRQEAADYLEQGHQLAQDNRLDEAIECYSNAIQTDPQLPWSYHSLGDIFTKKGQWDAAINCYCECIQLSPDTPWAYHALGDTLCIKGNFDEALFFYHRAVSLKPDLHWTHNALGNLYSQRGELDKAVHHYKTAIELEPSLEAAKTNLENVLERLNPN